MTMALAEDRLAGTTDAPVKKQLLALVGPWVLNKGDALMFRSVMEHFRSVRIGAPAHLWPAGVPEGVTPLLTGPTAEEIRGNATRPLRLMRSVAKGAVLSMPAHRTIPLTGRAHLREATGVLDCSGFGYGDDWTTPRMITRAETYAALKSKGARIAVLPQALGPFERPDMREAAEALFSLADLIFARDADSLRHLQGLDLGGGPVLRQAPDISHLLPPVPPHDPAIWRRRVAIVPNTRMLDKTGPERAAAYLDFLVDAVQAARRHGFEPVIVLHEANDGHTIAALNQRLEMPLAVLDEDAETTKGILDACHAVVASRYHALVSCLSQATPCIGTSWSHKYDRLFEEYAHDAFLLTPEGDRAERAARLSELLDHASRDRIAAALAPHAARQKSGVAAMWAEVDALFGLNVEAHGGPRGDAPGEFPTGA